MAIALAIKVFDGNIYVADFFFTTCPSICPIMHRNMLSVYKAFKSTGDFKIISYTIDPKHDSVPVLKKYADKLGVTGNTWWFLQGRKRTRVSINYPKVTWCANPEDRCQTAIYT